MESSGLVWPFGQANWDRLAAAVAAQAAPVFQEDYGPLVLEDEPLSPENEEMLF